MGPAPIEDVSGRGPLRAALIAGGAVFLVSLVSIFFLDVQAERNQTQAIRDDLSRLARAAAGLVDGEIHKSLVRPEQMRTPEYRRALAPLVAFHRNVPEIAYLYTLVERNGKFFFVLDTATAAEELGFDRVMEPSALLDPYQSESPEEDAAEMEALRKGEAYVSGKPFSDDYGTFLSGVAPIRDASGEVVGIVGVDLNVREYLERLRGVRWAGFLAAALALGTSILFGLLVWTIRRKSLRHERDKLRAFSDKDRLERRDRQLIRALGQIVYRHHLGRDWIEWDGDCEKILGDPASKLPRTTEQWRERIHPEDLASVDASFDVLKRTGAPFQADYRMRRSGGDYVWVQDRGLISRDESDGNEYVDGVLLDISARKAGEAELILARDRAEIAGRAKSEFLAVMSHEIRTPLNGVIGYTSLMMETALSGEQREYLDSIHFCSKSLLDLLNDILDFSKMESGKMELEHRPFSLRRSVEDVVSLYAHLAADRKLALSCEFLSGAPDWILGDSTRLRQVLVNLVGNAVKFTERGRIDVRVEPIQAAPGGKSFRLAVADTGIGISQDKITRLFKLFSQADSSMTRKYGGTGLGLAICSRLVDMMGGTLTVESREGAGSLFVLELPCVEPTKGEIFERLSTAESELESELEVPPLRIVVAEDNAVNRSLIRRILSDLGHESHMVSDGRECLAAVADGEFDMIFMDLQMPEMDGFETTRKLRELGDGIWITALTADAMPEDAERCREAGMNDYVSKPFTKGSIRRAIERCFRKLEQDTLAGGAAD